MGNLRQRYTDEEWDELTRLDSQPTQVDIDLVILREQIKSLDKKIDNLYSSMEELAKELVVKHEVVSPAMTYTDDSGNVVFTAEYHLKRGSCCTNGCKHCPYNGNEGKL